MDFSTIRGSDGYFCSVSTGKGLHQYTFKIKVLRNNPAVWATTDLESVTKLYHVDGSELMMSYFFQGTLVSSCYKPCVSTKVKLDFGII